MNDSISRIVEERDNTIKELRENLLKAQKEVKALKSVKESITDFMAAGWCDKHFDEAKRQSFQEFQEASNFCPMCAKHELDEAIAVHEKLVKDHEALLQAKLDIEQERNYYRSEAMIIPDLKTLRDELFERIGTYNRAINNLKTRLLEAVNAVKAMQSAANEVAAEFIEKKRAVDWGLVNDAYIQASSVVKKFEKEPVEWSFVATCDKCGVVVNRMVLPPDYDGKVLPEEVKRWRDEGFVITFTKNVIDIGKCVCGEKIE